MSKKSEVELIQKIMHYGIIRCIQVLNAQIKSKLPLKKLTFNISKISKLLNFSLDINPILKYAPQSPSKADEIIENKFYICIKLSCES